MPITDELKNVNKLEAAGFSTEQAKAITEVVEDGVQSGFEKFAEVLDRKFDEFESRIKLEIQSVRTEIQSVRAELMREQRELMLKFAALVSLIAIVTGAVIKFL